MSKSIIKDAVDYDMKVGLIRSYLGYYTDDDIIQIFDTDSLQLILTKFTYSEIRARLANTLTNTLEKDFEIGDVVKINKPYLRNGVYDKLDGVIIGSHWVFDEQESGKAPIYHTSYDILVQVQSYLDGYKYEVRHEKASDLILTGKSLDDIGSVMRRYAALIIDQPV